MEGKNKMLVIPQKFFMALMEAPPSWRMVWLYWLSKGVEIENPLLPEKTNLKNVSKEELRNCYRMGMSFITENIDYDYYKADSKSKKFDVKEEPKQEPTPKPKDLINYEKVCQEVIEYLNEKAETNFRIKNKATLQLITARMKEGFKIDDFKKVIDNKVYDWKGSDMEQYLRPITLFQGLKFENYLNQKNVNKERRSDTIVAVQQTIDQAKQKLFG